LAGTGLKPGRQTAFGYVIGITWHTQGFGTVRRYQFKLKGVYYGPRILNGIGRVCI